MNSLYDPDRTGTGHQPYGFDALSVAYNRYKVNSATVVLTFYNVQTLNTIDCAFCFMNPSNVGSTIAGLTSAAVGERQQGDVMILNNTGSNKITKVLKCKMPQLFGVTNLQYYADLDNTTAGVTSSPASVATLQLAVADPNGASSGGCRYKIKIIYNCTMYQRILMAQS